MFKAKGVIYVLTNPSFPEYVKIGFATDIKRRLKQLNRSAAIPYAFRASAVYEVGEKLSDRKLHDLIDKLDPDLRSVENFDGKTRKREFYRMSSEDAFGLLDCIATISGTRKRLHRVMPDGRELEEEREAETVRNNARRGIFTFGACGIKPGEKVYFKRDRSKFAVVVDDRHVRYGDEVTSLSALAKELLKRNSCVQGPLHFLYNGEVLADLHNCTSSPKGGHCSGR